MHSLFRAMNSVELDGSWLVLVKNFCKTDSRVKGNKVTATVGTDVWKI
jgi:hypothetical protein